MIAGGLRVNSAVGNQSGDIATRATVTERWMPRHGQSIFGIDHHGATARFRTSSEHRCSPAKCVLGEKGGPMLSRWRPRHNPYPDLNRTGAPILRIDYHGAVQDAEAMISNQRGSISSGIKSLMALNSIRFALCGTHVLHSSCQPPVHASLALQVSRPM
jgi:hypothetical protein